LGLAGLDFDVELRPIFANNDRGWLPIPDHRATYRTDRDEPLGVVGTRYRPLQNRDAFRILQPLLDSGRAALETAGSLRSGRDVWVLVRFKIEDPIIQEAFTDEVVPFGLLSNNHAGDRGVILQETPVRVVCANTLGAAHRSARGKVFKVRHTLSVEARTVDALTDLWGAIVERNRVIAQQYQLLRQCYLDEAAFRSLVLEVAAPISERWMSPGRSKQQQRALRRAEQRRARISDLRFSGERHKGDGSAWEAYNGAVEAIDHDVALWPTRGTRVESLFDGNLRDTKQRILDLLLDHARGGR